MGGWQRLIPENIINQIKIAIIGQHGSSEFLPRGRGRSFKLVYFKDRKRIVWNLFRIVPGIDDGPILEKVLI